MTRNKKPQKNGRKIGTFDDLIMDINAVIREQKDLEASFLNHNERIIKIELTLIQLLKHLGLKREVTLDAKRLNIKLVDTQE